MPKGWIVTELQNCVDILDGQRVPVNSREREERKGNVPYYGATGQIGWIDDFLFDQELLLLGEDGAPFLDPSKNKAYIIRGKSWVNNHAHVLRAKDSTTTNSYLCYYLNHFRYDGYISGTTRPKLNQAPMRRIPIRLAPFTEQKRIVSKIEELFTKLDAGIEYLKKARLQLKRYRQSVLKAAFEGKLTEEWRKKHEDEVESSKAVLGRIGGIKGTSSVADLHDPRIDFSIPVGWRWTTVGELTESMKNGVYKPKQFYSQEGIACLRMYNIEDGSIVWKDIKRMKLTNEEVGEYKLSPGDILVNRVNSRELVGKAALISEGLGTCIFESKNIRLRLLGKFVNSKFVNYWLLIFHRQYFNTNAQQTVGMASINQEQLASMPIPFAPLEEQMQVVESVEKSFSVSEQTLQAVEQGLIQTNLLRQSILKRAFEGNLVPQDPDDEPAEKLLARIKKERENQSGSSVQQKLIVGV